jgi:cobalt-zinc-cadmium efflux system protein
VIMGNDHNHFEHTEESHSHQHAHRKLAYRSLMGVLILSALYMFAEIIGGLISGSLALLADAGHMAIDTAAIALSLFAAWMAKKPANEGKTYGYYRAEILAALVNGATLFAISIWICYAAWERFHYVQPIRGGLMTGVAAGGLIVNLVGLLLVHKQGEHNLNTRGVWLHLLTDTLGSVSAILAGLMVWKLGWGWADPLISVVISLFILFGAWRLVRECVDVLLEAVPKGIDISEIKRTIESISGVREAHDLHVWTITSGVPLLTVHVALKEMRDPGQILKTVTEILVEKFHIYHVTIQIEPVGYEAPVECCNLPKQ